MEDRRNHRISIALTAMLVILSGVAAADEHRPPFDVPSTVVVSTGPDAAVIDAEANASRPGTSAPKPASRPKRKCSLRPVDTVGYIQGVGQVELPTQPDEVAYWLECDDGTQTIVWRKVSPPRAPVTPPRDIAMHLREEVPMPTVTIRVNPEKGLVGTESWFWIQGYSGEPITHSTDAFGRQVEVEARVQRYEWSFGDGTVLNGSPGRPYPERSDVRHLFEKSSARTGDGFLVQAKFVFSVRYRVGDGDWIELPGIARTASFRYAVRESQAVISR